MKLSIIILTFNEEQNIKKCLESLHQISDDIVIIDSYSDDKTLEICKENNCRIYSNKFINHALQMNWGLKNIEFKNKWILRLDADERMPNKLIKEILTLKPSNDVNGYYINKRMYWMNKWLRFGRMYPHYILRLFRNGSGKYEEKTEEHLIIRGTCLKLKNDFYEKNEKNMVSFFTQKHMQTAEGEVNEILEISNNQNVVVPKFFGNKVERTRWLKLKAYNSLPLFLRPFLYFAYRYFICLGFLDGLPGLTFHFLQAFWYRFYIDSRLYEDRLRRQALEKQLMENE